MEHFEQTAAAIEAHLGQGPFPVTDIRYLEIVAAWRAEHLPPDGSEFEHVRTITPDILAFVQERLSRCGCDRFLAHASSVAEVWDILDDFEYHRLMGT